MEVLLMAVATVPLRQYNLFFNQLDSPLFEICEDLQLPAFR
jgi:hypothetical protein